MRYLTAGESHGPALTVILEGCPAGLPISADEVNFQLARRQNGYGRGARQRIEQDQVEILSGVRRGETLGGPITLLIRNRDHRAWSETMAVEARDGSPDRAITLPRPGHADLPGALKYDRRDARDILERASARETAARVAAGAVARKLLDAAGIRIASCVLAIGPVKVDGHVTWEDCQDLDGEMPIPDEAARVRAIEAIQEARSRGRHPGRSHPRARHGRPAGSGFPRPVGPPPGRPPRRPVHVHPVGQSRGDRGRRRGQRPARVGGPRCDPPHARAWVPSPHQPAPAG